MAECFTTNIAVVPTIPDPCGGELKSTSCVVHEEAIAYLGLPANSTQEDINTALVLSLQDTRIRLELAEIKIIELEQRIEDLENP